MSDSHTPSSLPFRLLAGVGAVVLAVAVFLWASDFFFLLFTAILFGICLNRCAVWLADKTPLSRSWTLGLLVTAILLLIIGGFVAFGFQVEQQIRQASTKIDDAARQLNERLH
ncbi:MAG: AI-2E family transporter, partial [Planctomycetaceae bacterium]|nr:AI-2E family transporter [Planctomycetaceae bacterium]